ncbi:hemerythrin domain-containing protein [Auraticoccus sp. F435]|uniref:Hemerythrin domain-containing protein n=2 Tax=Auraticoccus cholistanensis TaxID=2656650 RepID=A0A6A9UV91_9ACTN|nr:hemerythrin domain-containing protein [Auraticoccus cholistanensis]MVA75542.1 hemerythrin domain-containing protein [Auraticoccus cholistanensis]
MRLVHQRLRQAVELARADAAAGAPASTPSSDLLLHCWGSCLALSGHHGGEDRLLFPALTGQHPELVEVVGRLRQDHDMIESLITAFREAVERREPPASLDRHLEGLAAVVESHFGYEERQLLAVLESLDLEAPVEEVLGPLAG